MSQDAGLFGNVRGIAADGVRALRTRLELASIEIQEEKARLLRQLALAAAALYLLSFGAVAAIFWIVTVLPEGQRATALGAITLVFLALGAGAIAWLARLNAQRKPLLATTLAVLRDDEQALKGRSP